MISISYGIGKNADVVKKIEKELIMPKKIPYQEVVISEDEIVQKFYYQQLDEDERLVYREILEGIQDNVDEIYIHIADAERANKIFQYVLTVRYLLHLMKGKRIIRYSSLRIPMMRQPKKP